MRLPAFAYKDPRDLDEALELLNTHRTDCSILAGGTDLLIRMKQGLTSPKYLISLKALMDLSSISEFDSVLRIGAAVRPADILTSQAIQERWPGLVEAVNSIGAPSIQHFRGTIGGNLCQDNRCRFYNQSGFFRGARQLCHKAGGNCCYSWEGGSDRCHSSCQSDAAPMLIAMDARAVLRSKQGDRTIPLAELYSGIGKEPLTLADNEILTEIQIHDSGPGTGTAYEKLAYRQAIDFPVVSAGAFLRVEGDRIVSARLVIGAVAGAPLIVSEAERILNNRPVSEQQAITDAGYAAMNSAKAFIGNNMAQPAEYRTLMVSVIAQRALNRALARTGATEEI